MGFVGSFTVGTSSPSGSPFELVFEDGFGMLVSQCSDRVLFLDEYIPENIYQVGSDLFVVEQCEGDADSGPRRWCLSARMREHEVRGCKLMNGVDEQASEVYTVRRPRCRSRLCWGIFDMYKLLDLSSYKGQPSKRAYNSFETWDKMLQSHGYENAIVKSWQGMSPELAMVEVDCIFPKPAIGIAGLLLLLHRWAGAKVSRGGLRDASVRMRAAGLSELS